MNARRLPPIVLALSPGDLVEVAGSHAPIAALQPCAQAVVNGLAVCLARITAAARGGLQGLLVREPLLSDRALIEFVRAARARLGPGAWIGVHDRVHLAATCAAQGVHVGFASLSPAEARVLLDDDCTLGVSTHAHDLAALPPIGDYLFFGPVRATPSKAGWVEPVGFDGLKRAVRGRTEPIWALGGLRPADVRETLRVGARGIAVRAGILGAHDSESAARAYLEAAQVA